MSLPLYPRDGKKKCVILDGGLGTTLEQTFGLDISNTALWSAKAAVEHPSVVVAAHLAFLRAGARIILTSTYQSARSAFERAGYADADARNLMVACVQLAIEARSRFVAEQKAPGADNDSDTGTVKIALSLGPFGAGLAPAQEFDGFYPPPFGPRAYTPDGGNCNAFPQDAAGRAAEAAATEALARFHFERLCVFADDAATWAAVDVIAFETVPLVREIRAIRTAVAALEARHAGARKPWWISCVFPGGHFPESALGEGDAGKVPVGAVVAAALGDSDALAGSARLPRPSALGINCTAMEAVPCVLRHMEAAVQEFRVRGDDCPWLVLYPNGGDVYDPVSQTWVVQDKAGVWGEELMKIVAEAMSRGNWAGVVAGGCCRTGPDDIALLSKGQGE
ncbi:Homocysteine S-methyltransferase [Mycena belliarum]|uniref:Homocysteine S-methyltransferase n=1 Tax=Mycena belliarum TaxID=1033014 RepID=A0AAD6XNE1_9AGAR|nr:Homocysteine S-methyltransferase [Mycena belliae]